MAGCWEIRDLITGNPGSQQQALSCIHVDPQFSIQQENTVICVERSGVLPIEMHYRIGYGLA